MGYGQSMADKIQYIKILEWLFSSFKIYSLGEISYRYMQGRYGRKDVVIMDVFIYCCHVPETVPGACRDTSHLLNKYIA